MVDALPDEVRSRRGALAALLVLALPCSPGCSRSRAAGSPNVLLVCLDTVRADHVGCYGYERRATTPAIDRLAARSTVFLDTSATAGWTKPSVPSFLTGTYPLQHGVYDGSSKDEAGVASDVLPERATTLAEVFAAAGYQTAAFVKNAQLRRGLGFEQGFDVYRDEAGDARSIRWWASDWLESRDPARPFFLYLHFLDAHWPYDVPDEYAARFAGKDEVQRFRERDWRALRQDINDGRLTLAPGELDALVALYDGSIRYIDDQLGRLLSTMERLDLGDDTVICVIADHGEEFLEHGRIGHGHGLFEGLLAVPWILHVPGRDAARREAASSLVDLFPTLLRAAGLDPGSTEGVDRLGHPDLVRPAFAEHLEPGSYQRSWRVGRMKATHVLSIDSSASPGGDLASVIQSGSRWEARLDPAAASPRVVRLRARAEDASLPVELKGPLAAGSATPYSINGVDVHPTAGVELYGEGRAEELQVGRMAKALGGVREGLFVAERIKVYAQGEEAEYEIRGPVGRIEDGRIELGGLWLALDEDLELQEPRARERFDRARVELLIQGDVEAWSGTAGAELCFDLDADPTELAPLERPVPREMADFCRELFRRRLWSPSDSARLSAEDLEGLRAIGYAE